MLQQTTDQKYMYLKHLKSFTDQTSFCFFFILKNGHHPDLSPVFSYSTQHGARLGSKGWCAPTLPHAVRCMKMTDDKSGQSGHLGSSHRVLFKQLRISRFNFCKHTIILSFHIYFHIWKCYMYFDHTNIWKSQVSKKGMNTEISA